MITTSSGNMPVGLVDEVSDWIAKGASQEEIIQYTSYLSDEDRWMAAEIGRALLVRLVEKKKNYFSHEGCLEFLKLIDEPEQRLNISYLSRYAAGSVLINLKKRYPLTFSAFPTAIAEWSKSYLRMWDGSTALCIAEAYLRQCVYASSMAEAVTDKESAEELKMGMEFILEREARYGLVGQATSLSELGDDRKFLGALTFFPNEYLDSLVAPENSDMEWDVLSELLQVLRVVLSLGIAEARADKDGLRLAVWEHLRLVKEMDQFETMEAARLAEYGAYSAMGEVVAWLQKLWIRDNIVTGAAVEGTLQYLRQADATQKKEFQELFLNFAANSFRLDAIFQSSDNSAFVAAIEEAQGMGDLDRVMQLIEKEDTDPLLEDLQRKTAEAIWKVLHA